MEDSYRYMIFRVYDKSERENPAERSVFFGWTRSKDVKKAFLSQRDKKKYKVVKMYDEDIAEIYSEDIVDSSTVIDYVNLKFASNPQEEIPFFTTANELKNAEINIQKYFDNLCTLENMDVDKIVAIFNLMDEYYADALEYIGFRPPILEAMFSRAGYCDGELEIDKIEGTIDLAYDGSTSHPEEITSSDHKIPGLSVLEDISKKILYSVESFIKVLKDDL